MYSMYLCSRSGHHSFQCLSLAMGVFRACERCVMEVVSHEIEKRREVGRIQQSPVCRFLFSVEEEARDF